MEQEVPTTGIMTEAQQWPGNFGRIQHYGYYYYAPREEITEYYYYSHTRAIWNLVKRKYIAKLTLQEVVSFNIRYS